jgi:hypothetical protein
MLSLLLPLVFFKFAVRVPMVIVPYGMPVPVVKSKDDRGWSYGHWSVDG